MDLWERQRRQTEAHLLRAHCEQFSRMGWALFWMAAVMLGVQLVSVTLAQHLSPWLMDSSVFLWLVSVVSVYGLGFPVFWLILRRRPPPPNPEPPGKSLSPVRFFQVYLIALAGLYLSNYATLAVTALLGLLRGEPLTNPVESMADYPLVLNLLLGCVIAPVVEETMFRRLLLDRLRPYGSKAAICISALCFGLFHGNLNQIPYAFVTGLVFGYVALRTGRIRQTILLHAMVNAISAGLLPLANRFGDAGAMVLGSFVLVSIVLGIIFFFVYRRDLRFSPGTTGFTERRKWGLFFGSPGVVFFLILEGVLVASYFF